MIEFKDFDGDVVRTHEDDLTPDCYCVTFAERVNFAVLTRDMARALAADLLEFADSIESKENDG